MRDLSILTGRAAAIFGLALLAAACGGEADEEPAVNAADAEMTLDEPANDATALESAVIDPDPAELPNAAAPAGESAPVVGETDGGDTGGNAAGSDVEGM